MTQELLKAKKMFLIFHGRFPSNKAASLFVAKNAEAFAEKGIEVKLIIPRRFGREDNNPYEYYKVKNNFKIVYLPIIDIPTGSFLTSLRFTLSTLSFSLFCYVYLLRHAKKEDVVYSNDFLPLFVASSLFPRTFYEMHDFPERGLSIFGVFIRRMKWLLIHNNWKAESAEKLFKIERDKVIVEPNAVQIEKFDIPITKEEARKKLSLPLDKKIVIYTGHLYTWKGVDTLALSAHKLPSDYLVVFVGGTPEDVKKLSEKNVGVGTILITGWKPHSEIPLWQKAGDVLVLPNTAKETISTYYTSPMKLFEYMASNRPIIASDIPSIREIVDEKSAIMVNPDDANALARAIVNTVSLKSESVSAQAYEDVKTHTWDKRAERVISFINSNNIHSPVSHKSKILLFSRYLFSGFLAFGTNLLLLFVFKHYLGWHYLSASTVSFIVSVIVSFLAQKFITFQDKSRDRVHHQLFKYVVIALFNVLVNGALMFSFVDLVHLSYLLSQFFSAGIIAFYSLFLYRFVIFSHVKLH